MLKPGKAVLEVIMRVNPFTCVQTHRMFLKDISNLLQLRLYFCGMGFTIGYNIMLTKEKAEIWEQAKNLTR